MREILFRGKRPDNGEWVYGYLLNNIYGASKPVIISDSSYTDDNRIANDDWEFVIPETIGQYTGLTDKDGKKIFEGDILIGKSLFHVYKECFVCIFIDGGFYFRGERSDNDYCLDNIVCGEIIDNIHDNPELLKGESNEL